MTSVVAVEKLPRPRLAGTPRRWNVRGTGLWRITLDCGHRCVRTYLPSIGHSIECPHCKGGNP